MDGELYEKAREVYMKYAQIEADFANVVRAEMEDLREQAYLVRREEKGGMKEEERREEGEGKGERRREGCVNKCACLDLTHIVLSQLCSLVPPLLLPLSPGEPGVCS